MIDESAAFVPLWMLLSAAFGFIVGEMCGDLYRHRKCLEQTNADLRDQLDNARAGDEPLNRELKRQRGVLHDIHKHVLAVSKGLGKHPS